MTIICVCIFYSFINVIVYSYPVDVNKPTLDKTNIDCIPPRESYGILDYNKLEVVNNFNKYPLKELIIHRGLMPEENQIYNQFIHCVWKKNLFLDRNDILNYDLLENLITGAIVNVVGDSGPAINLSILQATEILDQMLKIKGSSPGNKVAKMQNLIVDKLRPFAEI